MKYAMIVALVLLGACAPDDAELEAEVASEPAADVTSEPTREVATTGQPTLGRARADVVTAADHPTTPVQAQPALNPRLDLSHVGIVGPGGRVMSPRTDSNKPQPVPWVPPQGEDIPGRDEARTETKAVQGTAP